MKYLLSLSILLLMTGCSSEVDKCVDAYVKANDLRNPKDTPEEKASFASAARITCMQAQSGKSN